MSNVVPLALSRRRARLRHSTSYSHEGLQSWLCKALGAKWCVHVPQNNQDSPSAAWPSEAQMSTAVCSLQRSGGRLSDPEFCIDVLHGHCEQMALQLSVTAADMAESGTVLETLADTAQAALKRKLGGDVSDAVRQLFGDKASFVFPQHKGPRLWATMAPQFCPATLLDVPTCVAARTLEFVFGNEAAAARIRTAAAGEGICVLPVYVLCYIYDLDELQDEDMDRTEEETAQYSVHCVGLMLHCASRTAVVCVSALSFIVHLPIGAPLFCILISFPSSLPSVRTQMDPLSRVETWNSFAFRCRLDKGKRQRLTPHSISPRSTSCPS